MVKLVKINNGDQKDGRIKANFDNLEIEPNSQVALLNAALTIQEEIIEVTQYNNQLRYRVSPIEPWKNLELVEGTYSPGKFSKMLQHILNSGLEYTENLDATPIANMKDNGFQWQVLYDSNDVLEIMFNRTDRYENNIVPEYINKMTITDSTVNIPHTTRIKYKDYQRDDDINDGWDSYVIGDRYISTGASILMFETVTVDTLFVCGLIQSDSIDPNLTQLKIDDYDYCFFLENPNGNVQIHYINDIGDTDEYDTLTKATAGFRWRIMFSEGKISFSYRDLTQVWHDFISVDRVTDADKIDESRDYYYPALSIYSKKNAGNQGKIYKFAYYPDPYHYVDDFSKEYQKTVDNVITYIGLEAKIVTTVSLDFLDNQRLYGFPASLLTQKAAKYKWVGTNSVESVHLPNNLSVMLKNMQIEGYDSYSGDRADILMTIPTINYGGDNDSQNRISYETSTPIYIDINNNSVMNLNQLQIDLKEFDGTYLKLLPDLCDLTLLFRNKSEK